MNIDEIKNLIKELKILQEKRNNYNIDFHKIDRDTRKDIGLEGMASLYLKSVAEHFNQTDEKIEKADKKIAHYKHLFNTTIGKLVTEIIKEFSKKYPNLEIKPVCEVYGYYSKCDNTNFPLTARTARLMAENEFRGQVHIVIKFGNLKSSIDLGRVDDVITFDNESRLRYNQKIRRDDLHYDFKQYKNNPINIYDFLINDNYHPYYKSIQRACYNIVEENLSTLSKTNTIN